MDTAKGNCLYLKKRRLLVSVPAGRVEEPRSEATLTGHDKILQALETPPLKLM